MEESKKQLFWQEDAVGELIGQKFARGNYATADIGSPNGKTSFAFGGWVRFIEASIMSNPWYCGFGWNQSGDWGTTAIWAHAYRIGCGTSSTNISFSQQLPIDKWIHVIASFGNGMIKFYLDGKLYSSVDAGPVVVKNNDSTFRVAAITDGTAKQSTTSCCNVFVLDRAVDTEEDATKLICIKDMRKLAKDKSLVEAWSMQKLENGKFTGVKGIADFIVQGTAVEVEGPII